MAVRRLAPVLLLALGLGVLAHAGDEVLEEVTCPLDGQKIQTRLTAATNGAGGRDSDGCRWAVDASGRLEVLELRELVTCPRCGAALYRAHLAAARALHRSASEAAIASALASAGALEPAHLETAVAHAVATYRALGLVPFGISADPDAFEGRLWLRAAWAVRERLIRGDDGPVLPLIFAPRSDRDAPARLELLEKQAAHAGSTTVGAPIEDALGTLDQARSVLDPLDADDQPSRRFAFERVRGSLDAVEQTLLELRSKLHVDREVDLAGRQARDFALAVARAFHRAGNGPRREHWLAEATRGDAPPSVAQAAERIRALVQKEDRFLELAAGALVRAAKREKGEQRSLLFALAADATVRRVTEPQSELLKLARGQARLADEGAGPGARHAAFLLERIGR